MIINNIIVSFRKQFYCQELIFRVFCGKTVQFYSASARAMNVDKQVHLKLCAYSYLYVHDVVNNGKCPFVSVINVTLPDEKQNYIHRIGRVGRAER